MKSGTPRAYASRVRELLHSTRVTNRLRRVAAALHAQLVHARAMRDDWLRQKYALDREFDRALGVDTGVTSLRFLDVPARSRLAAVDHIAIDPDEFRRACAALAVDLSQFTFLDLGSGKGRAILLAAQLPFRRLIGVELAPELHRVAQLNVARCERLGARRDDIALYCADATEFELPNEPLVLYLYHPFGPMVLAAVVRRVAASHARCPRPLLVLYLNPFHRQVWTDAGFVLCEQRENYAILSPPERWAERALRSADESPAAS